MTDEFPEMPEKMCHKCKKPKKIMHFHRDKHSEDGFRNVCMECVSKRNSERYLQLPR